MIYKVLQNKSNYKKCQQYSLVLWSKCYPDSHESKKLWTYSFQWIKQLTNKIEYAEDLGHKGSHGLIADKIENVSFSVIWAFSEHWFYRIVINPQT